MATLVFSDEAALLAALQGNELERRQALQHFFENPRLLAWVVRQVKMQGGSEQDAKDVFEESFIVFERQIRTGHFRGESSLETWFHGIARWQWAAMRRKQRPHLNRLRLQTCRYPFRRIKRKKKPRRAPLPTAQDRKHCAK